MEMINIEEHDNGPKIDSVGGKIWYLVDKYYPTGRFTSSEILERYEDEYNEPVKLSVIFHIFIQIYLQEQGSESQKR